MDRRRRPRGLSQVGAGDRAAAGGDDGRRRLRPLPGHREQDGDTAHHHHACGWPRRRGHAGRRQAPPRRHRPAGRRRPGRAGLRGRQHRRRRRLPRLLRHLDAGRAGGGPEPALCRRSPLHRHSRAGDRHEPALRRRRLRAARRRSSRRASAPNRPGLTQVDSIEAWVPLFLFSCSSDSRWTTRFSAASRSATTRPATRRGGGSRLGRTAGITGAAAIMVCVFGGMATASS